MTETCHTFGKSEFVVKTKIGHDVTFKNDLFSLTNISNMD